MCVGSGLRGVGRDEHGAVAGELAVRLLAERDGGAHLRLLHHHRLQRPERPGAAARLEDHAVSTAGVGRRGRASGPGRGVGRRGRDAARAPSPPRLPERPSPPGGPLGGAPSAPTLRRSFPGLLLNVRFERCSGRCLRLLPVPHFPRPRPANEGAPHQPSGPARPHPRRRGAGGPGRSRPGSPPTAPPQGPSPSSRRRRYPRRLRSWQERFGAPRRRAFNFICEGPAS